MGIAIAISAVATTKIRNTSTAPIAVPDWCEKVTRLRFTALNRSSMHISMTSTLRLTITPRSPRANNATLTQSSSSVLSTAAVYLDDGQRADDRGDQQHRHELEVQPILGQECDRELRQAEDRTIRCSRPRGKALRHTEANGRHQQQERHDSGHEPARVATGEGTVAHVEQHDRVHHEDHHRADVNQDLENRDCMHAEE